MKYYYIFAALLAIILAVSLVGSPANAWTITEDKFTIGLPSNPTTGYSWQVSQLENIELIDSWYVSDCAEGQLGCGGTQYFRLQLVGKVGQIAFIYKRTFEDTVIEQARFKVRLQQPKT